MKQRLKCAQVLHTDFHLPGGALRGGLTDVFFTLGTETIVGKVFVADNWVRSNFLLVLASNETGELVAAAENTYHYKNMMNKVCNHHQAFTNVTVSTKSIQCT